MFFSETQVSFPLGTEEGAPQIGGLSVTDLQKDQITTMRGQRYGYATIAKSVGLKKDAVVAFCRKAGLTGTKATDNSRISLSAEFCPQCGAALRQTPGRKRAAAVSPGGTLIRRLSGAKPSTALPAPAAAEPSPPTATPGENTALMPATFRLVSKAVLRMNEAAFQSELQYQAAVSIAKSLLRQGLLTREEYAAMDTALAAAFEPILGALLSENEYANRTP